MISGKREYLKRLTSQFRMRSVKVGRELDGSTPPSVFVGSWNYPKVYAGPMMAPEHGDTSLMDTPEDWIASRASIKDVVGFRMNLVRGKRAVGVTDLDDRLVEKLRSIALSSKSVEGEVSFRSEPRGSYLTGESAPHGPSAELEGFTVGNCRWDRSLEKTYYDTDLKAGDAVMGLYEKGLPFSRIQKAFSVGSMGTGKKRRMVPTRWSITACDSTLADALLKRVRHYPVTDVFRVYEFDSLNNRYAVILTPTPWQYEWIEAFLHVMGRGVAVFGDHETTAGKKGYSSVGGCYYSCKFAVLEALEKLKEQAGAIILREAYRGYVPLGVFNVRENVRAALKQPFREFHGLKEALVHAGEKFELPVSRFIRESSLLREMLVSRQSTLSEYSK